MEGKWEEETTARSKSKKSKVPKQYSPEKRPQRNGAPGLPLRRPQRVGESGIPSVQLLVPKSEFLNRPGELNDLDTCVPKPHGWSAKPTKRRM